MAVRLGATVRSTSRAARSFHPVALIEARQLFRSRGAADVHELTAAAFDKLSAKRRPEFDRVARPDNLTAFVIAVARVEANRPPLEVRQPGTCKMTGAAATRIEGSAWHVQEISPRPIRASLLPR